MVAARFRHASPRAIVMGVILAVGVSCAFEVTASQIEDAEIVWHEDDRRDIPRPKARNPNLYRNYLEAGAVRPLHRWTKTSSLIRRIDAALSDADHVQPAANVNSLDEVPNCSWFTNRIGLFPMSPEEAAQDPGADGGPDRSASWTLVSAKTEGVTPGFNIRDRRGDIYLIKFDPPGYPGMTSAAGVICDRLFHAAGYNVPDDGIVYFRRDQIRLSDEVTISVRGKKRKMTEADLDEMLNGVTPSRPGEWRALYSKFLDGVYMGPFDYVGRRKDDPNDHVDHRDRRELRGLRVFASWLYHFDTKQHNSLDMFVEEDDRHFIRHYLIDFASTLGSGAEAPSARFNWEYAFDPLAGGRRLLTLGIYEDPWRKVVRPEGLDEIGYFESDLYDPYGWKPQFPNSAFARMTDRDGYWAAKIVSAFTDDHLRAVVAAGRYENPRAAEYMVETLAARRDKVAREWFDRLPPLDFFRHQNGQVTFRDLGEERSIYPGTRPEYRVRVAAVDQDRAAALWSRWIALGRPELTLVNGMTSDAIRRGAESDYPFIAIECQVNRGADWSRSVTAYVARRSGRIIAIDR